MGLFSSIINGAVSIVTGIVETVVSAVATAIAAPTLSSICGAIAAVGLVIAGGYVVYKIGSKIADKILGNNSSSGGSATVAKEASEELKEEAHRDFCDYYGIEDGVAVNRRRPESYYDVADAVTRDSRRHDRDYDIDYDYIDIRRKRHPFEDRFTPRYYEPIGLENKYIDIDECIVDGKKVKTNKPKKKKHKKFKGIKDVAKYKELFDPKIREEVVDNYFDHYPAFGGDGNLGRYNHNLPPRTFALN